jgi:hypothetical protein
MMATWGAGCIRCRITRGQLDHDGFAGRLHTPQNRAIRRKHEQFDQMPQLLHTVAAKARHHMQNTRCTMTKRSPHLQCKQCTVTFCRKQGSSSRTNLRIHEARPSMSLPMFPAHLHPSWSSTQVSHSQEFEWPRVASSPAHREASIGPCCHLRGDKSLGTA